jgi:hypothetical protein
MRLGVPAALVLPRRTALAGGWRGWIHRIDAEP